MISHDKIISETFLLIFDLICGSVKAMTKMYATKSLDYSMC